MNTVQHQQAIARAEATYEGGVWHIESSYPDAKGRESAARWLAGTEAALAARAVLKGDLEAAYQHSYAAELFATYAEPAVSVGPSA